MFCARRFLSIIDKRAKRVDFKHAARVFLDAFGCAAAACVYCSTYYPFPEAVLDGEQEPVFEDTFSGVARVSRENAS